eukprot:1994747-Alexandrium_andersonii.AAC.1
MSRASDAVYEMRHMRINVYGKALPHRGPNPHVDMPSLTVNRRQAHARAAAAAASPAAAVEATAALLCFVLLLVLLVLLLGAALCRAQPAVAAAASAAACSRALPHASDWDCCSRCTLTRAATP